MEWIIQQGNEFYLGSVLIRGAHEIRGTREAWRLFVDGNYVATVDSLEDAKQAGEAIVRNRAGEAPSMVTQHEREQAARDVLDRSRQAIGENQPYPITTAFEDRLADLSDVLYAALVRLRDEMVLVADYGREAITAAALAEAEVAIAKMERRQS